MSPSQKLERVRAMTQAVQELALLDFDWVLVDAEGTIVVGAEIGVDGELLVTGGGQVTGSQ
jgi:hypothetical protein